MAMKLRFKVQQYQTEAVDAVVDCFEGQAHRDPLTYRIDPGADVTAALELPGLRNAPLDLSGEDLLTNIQAVQRRQTLPLSKELTDSPATTGTDSKVKVNLDIEMETGTGKTYVYTKTMLELHKRYGWSKYIVVVPSIAIREGVKKSFEVTAGHFQEAYSAKPRVMVYDSRRLQEVEAFSSNPGVQVMIINMQAFNATGKDARRINEELDDFGTRRPIDLIAANRPILIIDEPQKIEGDAKRPSKTAATLARFNPLFVLRYSATHKRHHCLVHRLDAIDAYNAKLVKRIASRGIGVQNLVGSGFLYFQRIDISPNDPPTARVLMDVRTASGIGRRMESLTEKDRLFDISHEVENYRGLTVVEVDPIRDRLELSNGTVLTSGDAIGDVTEDDVRRIQIDEVITAHLDKEAELFSQGIKVLSLFFVDEVAKYRDYSREDQMGEYARLFEDRYRAQAAERLDTLPLSDAELPYRRYLEATIKDTDAVHGVHAGYFSIDKHGHQVDSKVSKRGEDKGESTDTDAYDLILKNKERLLSLDEPVRFLFSHSALREGWDNPNVFTIGLLRHSNNQISRRQEVGRGLRLAVNQDGERVDDPAISQQVNVLTVVTDQSDADFIKGLQREIVETLNRPREVTEQFFAQLRITAPDGAERKVTAAEADAAMTYIKFNGYLDQATKTLSGRFLDDFHNSALPATPQPELAPVADLIWQQAITVLYEPISISRGHAAKINPLNQANFAKREFQELWHRINHKAVYQVDFDSDELVRNCVAQLDAQIPGLVPDMRYTVTTSLQNDTLDLETLRAGAAFHETEHERVAKVASSAASTVRHDVLGEIAKEANLTRKAIARVLGGIRPTTFAKYRANPERFIHAATRLIKEQVSTTIVEKLTYDLIDQTFDTDIFETATRQDLSRAVKTPNRHIYEYALTDSAVEREFAEALDAAPDIAVYAKLPKGFYIPTPMGPYNPDWAIAFRENERVKHIYFVAETKGSMSTMELRQVEKDKIECARRLFDKLRERVSNERDGITYDVVDSYQHLLDIVTTA
jgi:type III restriction enzyme